MNQFIADQTSCYSQRSDINRYAATQNPSIARDQPHRWVELFLILGILVLGGCKTVPIQDRNYADRGGFWEQGVDTQARFHHQDYDKGDEIGVLFTSGQNTMLNGASTSTYSDIDNDSFVSSGLHSAARVEFKGDDENDGDECVITIDRFNWGDAYADTYDCWYHIKTPHALLKAKNAILHIDVTSTETEVIVISGAIKVFTHGEPVQSIDIHSDQEVVISHQTIHRPRSIAPDEIWKKISWRANFQMYKTVIDWRMVAQTAVIVGVVAATIAIRIFAKGGRLNGFTRSRGLRGLGVFGRFR